jgi:hypothetical protein
MGVTTFSTALKQAPKLLERIDEATMLAFDNEFRPHLGASLIGRPCERSIWYSFRWSTKPQYDARIIRLLARGHREESVVADLLRKAEVTLHQFDPHSGKQFRFTDCSGHFGGSMDGAAHQVPDAPKTWHVWECKTSNKKAFDQLLVQGVETSKPEHWAQMQCYMHWSGMKRALYTVICKDDDRLHIERVDYDELAASRFVEKAKRIIDAAEPPDRIGKKDSADCRWCEHHAICHGEKTPLVSCRTCLHGVPDQNSTWSCKRHSTNLDTKAQQAACDDHRFIPQTIHWVDVVQINENENSVTYRYSKTGGEFMNAAPPGGFLSRELHAAKDKAFISTATSDENFMKLRQLLGGEIIA